MTVIGGVAAILSRIQDIHSKKNEDYSSAGKSFENFDRTELLISWFNHNKDKVYINHIATKLARLATLLNKTGEPNNESIDDTMLDLCTYCILWYANYQFRNMTKTND